MQFLLTQKEYERLAEAAKREREALKALLQDLCTRMAESEPVKPSWRDPDDPPRPWGCILNESVEYCDECPVLKECPYKYKEYSK